MATNQRTLSFDEKLIEREEVELSRARVANKSIEIDWSFMDIEKNK